MSSVIEYTSNNSPGGEGTIHLGAWERLRQHSESKALTASRFDSDRSHATVSIYQEAELTTTK